MKILSQVRTGNEVTLQVEVEKEELEKEKEAVFQQFAKRVKIPGFRPGKAPRALVRKQLSEEAQFAQATENLAAHLYPKMIDETNLEPIERGKIEKIDGDATTPMVITYVVSVTPEVKLDGYKGLSYPPVNTTVETEEIDQVISRIQERFATYPEVKDRPTQLGDLIEINVTATKGGEPYPLLTRPTAGLLLGEGQVLPAFDEALVGLNIGDSKSFQLTFPPDHTNEELKGAEIGFQVILNKVAEKKLPELNDSFAKQVGGGEVTSLEVLKSRIETNLADQKKREGEMEQRNILLEQVLEKAEVNIPEVMTEREIEQMLEELTENLKHDRATLDDYLTATQKTLETLKQEFREGASRRVKSRLVLEAISTVENIPLPDEELENELMQLANRSQKSLSEYTSGLSKHGLNYIRKYLLRQKAMEWLLAQGKEESKEPEPAKEA